ncbi:MAG TPA: HipA family kinase [Thermomicrobiales bacterium]|nr:HipA family kinase [Thermomicrobiales bacterium]
MRATRYVAPLREGGSLPAIVEADDDGMYVVKFHGAGQGPKALVAETIAGEVGRQLGLHVPDLVEVDFAAALSAAEPDPEIQELLERSAGLNFGIDYLPGALAFTPGAAMTPEAAADIVWFDAFVTNVDRTPRNPNLLLWGNRLWLIDHGAALFAQHGWTGLAAALVSAASPFAPSRDHVLLTAAGSIADADGRLAPKLTEAVVEAAVAAVPDVWLEGVGPFATPEEHRAAYRAWLRQRLAERASFVEEAERARLAIHG